MMLFKAMYRATVAVLLLVGVIAATTLAVFLLVGAVRWIVGDWVLTSPYDWFVTPVIFLVIIWVAVVYWYMTDPDYTR